MSGDLWITVPNWERFQHYGLARNPPWIKVYTELLRKDEYVDLTLAQRGLLHGIWLAYAASRGQLRVRHLPSVVTQKVPRKTLEALNQAGFIGLRASRPLSLSLEELPSTSRSSKGRGSGGREATPKGAALRRRTAEEWLAGPGRLVPESQLADDLREKLKITDPETLAQLLARAQEFRT